MGKFDPSKAERLLSAERLQWQNPRIVLDSLGLTQGMTFADIGCGPGFFSIPAAERVGATGRVYALDIEPAMLRRLIEWGSAEGFTNIETIVSLEDKLPLPDEVVDRALLAHVLHECVEPFGLLRETARVMRPSGVLGVVEWRMDSTEKGPPLAERISQEYVESILWAAGYVSVEPFEAGPCHYGIRAWKRPTRLRIDAATSMVRGACHDEQAIEPCIRD